MLITAVCPACETRWKLQPSLRGQNLRCPNPQCRHLFTVIPVEPAAPTKPKTTPPNGQQAGSVGELVPMLPAEAEAAPAPPQPQPSAPTAAPSWQQPPPVRRAVDPAPLPAAEAPREVPAGAWEPPPVRRGAAAPPQPPPAEPADPPPAAEEILEEVPDEPVEHHVPAKRTGLIIAALVVGVLAVLGGAIWAVFIVASGSEEGIAKAADDDYAAHKYTEASGLYQQLADKFPGSGKRPYYQMMQGLCALRKDAAVPQPDVSNVLDELQTFITSHKDADAPLVKEKAPELGEVVGVMAEAYARQNPNPQDEAPLPLADRIDDALAKVTALDPNVPSAELRGRIDGSLGGVRQAVARVQRFKAAVARIKAAADAPLPVPRRLVNFRRQVKREQIDQPDVAGAPEVRQIQDELYKLHQTSVAYSPKAADLPAAPAESGEASFVITPLLRGEGKAAANDPVVLSVARGVLYALRRSNGQIRWAVRVGVDVADLPVRVPEAEGVPERILVPSADAQALDAFDANGDRLWRYPMGAACVGRPLVVGNLAYLAAADGKVHEIELAQGKLVGLYDLGQPLSVGGAIDPATNLLYFPADDFCVYVLDPTQHRCVQVLYSGHPAGSLRGAPLVITPDPEDKESWLVLNETDGLGGMRLRAYALPIKNSEQPPEKLQPEPRVPGWSWFPPYCDGEKLAMLGDTGVLGLFGIRQARNPKDPPLFPMLPQPLSLGASGGDAPARGRSEVVEVQGQQDFWMLAAGKLRHMVLELNPEQGPQMRDAAGWPRESPALGSPLHASQVEFDPDRQGTTLVLTTRALNQQTCLATALDDQSGEILWQRQLGLVCRGDPLELKRPGGGPPVLLALDQGGGLFAFDPAAANVGAARWYGGEPAVRLVFGGLDDGPGAPPVLLRGPDGASAYEIACPGDGAQLLVRVVKATATGVEKSPERKIPLKAPLAGTPALTEKMIVLPLANGVLDRLDLPLGENPTLIEGPNWRARRAAPDARGRVTAVGPNEFLVGNGARGLLHLQWAEAKMWKSLPAGRSPEKPTLEWKGGTLAADPVLLPESKERQVCIADVTGGVALLTVADDGLKPTRRWDVGGAVTAGPYVETLPGGATRIACVVNGRVLVWIDPEKDGPDGLLWKYPAEPGADLVGRPRLVGGLVVVADESGRIVGVDPEKGTAGKAYQLQGSTAPAASPAGFGPDRLFVPLTDGTVLLPTMDGIR